jgi:DNA-directed RNA polymerase specialized sigma subunit
MTTCDIPEDVAETLKAARQLELDGRERITRAADMLRNAAEVLRDQGRNQNQIAAALGVSRQRVSQLFKPRG